MAKSVLVVGNPGSFSREMVAALRERYSPTFALNEEFEDRLREKVAGDSGALSPEAARQGARGKGPRPGHLPVPEAPAAAPTGLFDWLDTFEAGHVCYVGGAVRDETLMPLRNVRVPEALATYCAARGVRFVYLGSLSIWEAAPHSGIVNEDTPPAARSTYGRTKLEFEQVVDRLRAQGLRAVGIAPASIVGARARGSSIEQVIDRARQRPWLRRLRFTGKISFVTRGDVARALCLALAGELPEGRIILARNVAIDDVIRQVAGPVRVRLSAAALVAAAAGAVALARPRSRALQSLRRLMETVEFQSARPDALEPVETQAVVQALVAEAQGTPRR